MSSIINQSLSYIETPSTSFAEAHNDEDIIVEAELHGHTNQGVVVDGPLVEIPADLKEAA